VAPKSLRREFGAVGTFQDQRLAQLAEREPAQRP